MKTRLLMKSSHQSMNTTLRQALAKYTYVGYLAYKELLAYPASLLGRLAIHALRITYLGIIYEYVFTHSGKSAIHGMDALHAVWALALVQLVYQLTGSGRTFKHFKDEIISGQIEVRLNKPYYYPLQSLADALGQAPIRFVLFFAITALVLGSAFGMPTFTIQQKSLFLPLLSLGVLLFVLTQQLLSLSAFWIEDPTPAWWVLSKIAWIINGTFIPLAILPAYFKTASLLFPLSASFFLGRIYEITDWYSGAKFVGIQLLWILLIYTAIYFTYKQGAKKISINGG